MCNFSINMILGFHFESGLQLPWMSRSKCVGELTKNYPTLWSWTTISAKYRLSSGSGLTSLENKLQTLFCIFVTFLSNPSYNRKSLHGFVRTTSFAHFGEKHFRNVCMKRLFIIKIHIFQDYPQSPWVQETLWS